MPGWPPLPAVRPELPTRRKTFLDIEILGGVSVGGDIVSANWDGTTPLALSSADSGATVGYGLDASEGAIQVQQLYAEGGEIGNLSVVGNITLSTSGVIRTAASGQRIQIATATLNAINFFSGDSEETQDGVLQVAVNGSGDTRTLQASLISPVLNLNDWAAALTVRSASDDGTTIPGVVISRAAGGGADSGSNPEFRIQNAIRLISDGVFHTTSLGSASNLTFGMGTNSDDGIFSPQDGNVSIAIAGNEVIRIAAARVEFNVGGLDFIQIPVKTDTGDPSSPVNGDLYVNVQDNKVRVFADAAWRDLATW